MEEVRMTFDEKGNPSISVKGVKGKACKDITRPIEEKLGVVVNETKTREFNEAEVNHVRSRVRNSR